MISVISNDPPLVPCENSEFLALLRSEVEEISIPRHYTAEPEANKKVFQHILDRFLGYGYQTRVIGQDRNILAFGEGFNRHQGPYILIGAHYDSVPETPGADDNASAVVAMLQVAARYRGLQDKFIFAAFNREEDGLLGSKEVAEQLKREGVALEEVHILEMVGFTAKEQRVPDDLPITFPRDEGDFIALLGNNSTNIVIDILVDTAAKCNLPAVGIKTSVPTSMLPGVLHRSDHSSFWAEGYPSVLWTDTAEFRTDHYHQKSDTPDTLDYDFMSRVINTLITYLG